MCFFTHIVTHTYPYSGTHYRGNKIFKNNKVLLREKYFKVKNTVHFKSCLLKFSEGNLKLMKIRECT